ncbi:C2H2 zinc finger domain-containing protein [Histoplasma ohiense]|nr:C2H2 zinc finger domain-containing protein [Histoplasma ohiense (nom. inval.)]
MTSSLATRVVALERANSHQHLILHDSSSQNHLFMDGRVHPSSDSVTFHNPLSRTSNNPAVPSSTSIVSKPGAVSSFLKSAEPKGGYTLSSIASAGLRASPSPIMATNSRLSPQPRITSSLDRRDRSRERASTQQIPRDLGRSSSDAPNESRDKFHDAAASTPTGPVDGAQKSAHISTDDQRTDSHMRRTSPVGMSDTFDGGDNIGTTTLINSRTVASPGPIEEPDPIDNETSRHREEDVMMEDGNKAFSYPVPMPASNMNDSRRGMSLPHAGFNKGTPRSPSAKKHRCHHCATEFTRHHNLKSHLLTHSQEKPYVCQTCQSRFRRLHDLKRHTKLHTGERPHICPKCGRRFARGDALARHNKGQGGCAGRRSSLGSFLGDDEYGDGGGAGGENGMEGLMYTEPDRMDEEDEKRLNMPSIKKHNPPDSDQRSSSTSGGHVSFQSHQSSTYPPLAAGRSSQGSLFPPVTSHPGSSASPSPISQSGTLSFPPGAGSGSSSSLNAHQQQQPQGSSTSVFAQNNISESPKPLSPNVVPTRQLSHGPEHNAQSHSRGGGLSPSLKPQYPSQQFGRNGSTGASSGPAQILPAPQPGAPQLPLPHGLNNPDTRFPLHSPKPNQSQQSQSQQSLHLSSHAHHHHHHSQNHSNISNNSNASPDLSNVNNNNNSNNNLFLRQRQLSTSSHHSNTAGSSAPSPDRVWSYIRTLEDRVNGLEEELVRLRDQLAAAGGSCAGAGAGNVANGA